MDLTQTESGNGFANRFLWISVRRSKVLPEGGKWGEVQKGPFVRLLKAAIEFASRAGELRRDEDARTIWREVYGKLSEGHPGLFGAVTGRAEAQVMRLALIYALLDHSDAIRAGHLTAALAVWQYAEQSALFIFGDASGNRTVDEILVALRANPNGMTRTNIRDHFGRNKSAEEIVAALSDLSARGLARKELLGTDGRPAERWFATRPDTTETTLIGAPHHPSFPSLGVER